MTDGKMIKVMERIQRLSDQIQDLMDEELLDHPNGESIRGELRDNGLGYRFDCASIAQSHLLFHTRWQMVGGKLKWKPPATEARE